MNLIFKFIKILFYRLREIWIIEIVYPRKYSSGLLRSLIPTNLLKNSSGLFIENNVQIRNSNIVIGKHTYIGYNTVIDTCSRIGAFVLFHPTKKCMRNHPLTWISTSPVFFSKYRNWLQVDTFNDRDHKDVVIEDDVLISANVVIVNGVKIGRGAVIGAGAVVINDVPAYAIVAGVPAKIIRYRFSDELIHQIEASAWWTKEDMVLKELISYANNPSQLISMLK